MAMKHTYKIEVTDTFGGEANYCWVRRYEYRATSPRGAVCAMAREHGAGWRLNYSSGDLSRYDLGGAAVCCFVELSEG